MNAQPTVSEILDNVSRLGAEDFESLFKKMAVLHAQRSQMPALPREEADLLGQINAVFPPEKWERLQYLDWKMETTGLGEQEATESQRIAAAYESHTVRRLQLLAKLADLRKVPLDVLMEQLEIKPLTHA
jgi:hypothetical protein